MAGSPSTLEHLAAPCQPLSVASGSLCLGDCREVLAGKGPWDMVLTSPPYNAKKPYNGFCDDMPEPGYWKLIADVAALTFSECRDGAYALWNVPLWHGKRPKKYRPDQFRATLQAAGWQFRDEIIWAKGTTPQNAHAGGYAMNWPHTPSIRNPYEPILVFLKPGKPRPKPDWPVERWAKETIGLWCIQPERSEHPCTFPLALADKAVRLYSAPGEVVCDPFAGSGTTWKACADAGRNFIGAEASPFYCEMARQRLSANAPVSNGPESGPHRQSNDRTL